MEKHGEYVTGWIDTDIHSFLSEIDEVSSSMSYALITCLDSDPDVASLLEKSKHVRPLKGKCNIVGRGIVLRTRQLLAAEQIERLFFGFDEVWFFPDRRIIPKPEDLVITRPREIGAVTERFSGWMQANNCSLGLGDGEGMNFWLRTRGAAKHVVTAYSEAARLS